MELRLSLHEVVTKCTQALQALNFPPGLDIENGKNIGWLEAHGLPGLSYLYQEIEYSKTNLGHTNLKVESIDENINVLGDHNSGFSLAQSVVDLAETGKLVTVMNCRYPLLLLAEMARRTHSPLVFQIQWSEELNSNIASSMTGLFEIEINSLELFIATNLKIFTTDKLKDINSAKKLEGQGYLIKEGISCDPYQWKVVCDMARKILVQDSQQSRNNAGANTDDSL